MHGAVVLVLLQDLRMLFHHFLFLLCVAFPAVVGHCWDKPWATMGAYRAEGRPQCPLLPAGIPQAPHPAVCPSQVGTWLHFICLGNPKTAEMLVPRREEEPRWMTPWQPCPSHVSHWSLAAGTAGPPTLVCVRGAPPAPALQGHFVAL